VIGLCEWLVGVVPHVRALTTLFLQDIWTPIVNAITTAISNKTLSVDFLKNMGFDMARWPSQLEQVLWREYFNKTTHHIVEQTTARYTRTRSFSQLQSTMLVTVGIDWRPAETAKRRRLTEVHEEGGSSSASMR
jgi:hypothetical protein